MSELLAHLFRRGVSGSASDADQRILAYLADPAVVNRKVFGQPLALTLPYYEREYLQILLPRDRWPTSWRAES